MDQACPPVVEMRGLSLLRGNRPILDGIDLRLEAGQSLAVVGPSGAGKTTILRLLAGLEMPSAGELHLFGRRQNYLRLDQQLPPDVRLVSQTLRCLGSLSVLHNVGFLLYRGGLLSEAQRSKSAWPAVWKRLVWPAQRILMPAELSGGMQKRVSFARAMIDDPAGSANPLLLFDEPTAGLDPVASTRIEDLMVTTTRLSRGTSVVVSHVLSTIERSAEQVVLLYDGKLRWQGSVEAFRCSDNPYVVQFRTASLTGPMQPQEL